MDITINAPLERVADLLCCAFEGGVGYWARIDEYFAPAEVVDLGKHWTGGPFKHVHYPLSEGGAVMVRDVETGTPYRLDLPIILRGLVVMAEKAPRHFGDWLAENDDATTGDVFIQCCLLGEVVYG